MALPRLPRLLADPATRCELMFTGPFTLLAGGLFGWHAARWLGLPALLAVPLFALALTFFVGVQVALEPVVVEALGGDRGQWGPAVAWLWDTLTGALVGAPVLAVLGTPALPAAGIAATAGGIYGYVMGVMVCGEGPRALVGLLTGSLGGRTVPGHSRARTLEARGDVSGALEEYRRALERDARDPEAWLGAARTTLRQGDPEEAVRLLREARRRARLDAEGQGLLVRKIAQAREVQGRPEAAAPDLARYLESGADGPHARWARARLSSIKKALAARHEGVESAEEEENEEEEPVLELPEPPDETEGR